MPIVSQKRQVTLPLEQCSIAGINPGDEYESFVSRKGIISIVTKHKGAAKGLLKGIPVNKQVSDEESLESAIHA
jgi:bifunctional DNA-binding transcriptional regulator/antitoxin component of YhaV-PrlF toxin-antitoxin module